MTQDKDSSSDDSSDSFPIDFHGVQEIFKGGSKLQADWEAVERTLYQEENLETSLKANIAHECRLWKEKFPYLRVRGQRIDDPANQRKQQLKQQVISTVVDQLIRRITGEACNLGQDRKVQRPAAPSRESYFERGKHKQGKESGSGTALIPTSDTSLSVKEPSPSPSETTPKQLPRGILKNSPKGPSRPEEKSQNKKSTSQNSFRNTSLPRINSKNNNWLNRSERRCSEATPNCRYNNGPTHCRKTRRPTTKGKFVLPPITPHIDIK